MYSFRLIVFIFSAAIADETIKYAAIIYRHGDRTPVDTYPTDPYKNESLWPARFGELTNTGKQQHYALGQWLRERYNHLLSKQFDPKEIKVRSTDVDRTLMSAQVNLAGMYPPVGRSIWNKNINWQPIPIHTEPEADDAVLAMKKNCSVYNVEMQRFMHTKDYKTRLAKYQQLMNYLSAYTGKPINDYYDILSVYSVLYIETLYNFTLPSWTKSVFPKKMKEPACYSFSTSAATPLLARLRAGPLLKDIMKHVKAAMAFQTASHPGLKLSVYSGHDFTVGTILTALGMFDYNCPVYTATIFVELIFETTTRAHFIRISYRNTTKIAEPTVLSIPYCGQLCPVDRFETLYQNLLTVNFDADCNREQIPAVMGVSCLLGVVFLISVFMALKLHADRNKTPTGSHYAYTNFNSSGKVVFKPNSTPV